jgi:ribulose-phosphate 3-epimerase
MKMILSASILSADFSYLKDQIAQAEEAGVDWIHIDVADGHFVPNISMGPFIVETCRRLTSLPLDVHLMIENPDKYISDFARAGANHLTVHIEHNANIHRTLGEIRNLGCLVGIASNPGTPIASLSAILSSVDLILLMSVDPGFSGQKFIPESFRRVRELKQALDAENLTPFIQVDGGVNAENLPSLQTAGATSFVCATSIFKHPAGIAGGIHALRAAGI